MVDSSDSPRIRTEDKLPQVFAKDEGVVLREIAGEIFLVPIRGHLAQLQQIFVLSPVGSFIWDQIDGAQTLGIIGSKIVERFSVESDTALQDLVSYVQELETAGLIVPRKNTTP